MQLKTAWASEWDWLQLAAGVVWLMQLAEQAIYSPTCTPYMEWSAQFAFHFLVSCCKDSKNPVSMTEVAEKVGS